jgi:hypothetical protein
MISTAHSPRLAARFGQNTFVIRSETPLAEDQMRRAAPSIFAEGKHGSRSERYTYIPTIDVLRGLRQEGFEPFMVAQSKSRIEGKTEFTKHMIRMRNGGQVNTRPEANEIILINSHDGASSYQMLAGVFRLCRAGHRRHTTAMHLLQSGVPFNVIALWLGHESMNTTHRYVEANLAMKEKALARLEEPDTTLRRFRASDALLKFLQSL